MSSASAGPKLGRAHAVRFILLMGLVSLFADMTYEGARSSTGPFLLTLGASAGAVGFVAGLGELVGYALRLGTGYLADRTRQYWLWTFVGYGINVFAVPLLAVAGMWEVAAGLVVAERFGKAVRGPAKDVLLSHAASQVGRGFAFGLHEAVDQIGAVTGPLIVAAAVFRGHSYSQGFAFLAIPAVLSLLALAAARWFYPKPEEFEREAVSSAPDQQPAGAQRSWWRFSPALTLYITFAALAVGGFAHFQLISFHIKARGLMGDATIPAAFAMAMAVDAVVAPVVGRLYDKRGLPVLALMPVGTAVAAFLLFNNTTWGAWSGMVVWGVALGMQESVLKAAVANLAPRGERGRAFGLYYFGFGVSWFLGSVVMGFLYGWSIPALLAFVVATQVAALAPLAGLLRRRQPVS